MEDYVNCLGRAHERCINCLEEHTCLEITLSCSDEPNVVDIPIRVRQIEDSIADIKEYLIEARKRVEQNLSGDDYRKNTLIGLLEALEGQLTPATSCKDTLLKELASIIQKLLDIGQEAADGSENEPKPFTIKDLDISETINHLAKVNMIIERLTPVIEAMATKSYQISLPSEIPADDGRIGKIEEIRQSLMETLYPSQMYSSRINKHKQPDVVLCAKSEFLGVLYLAHSKTVSWLNDNKDSYGSWGGVKTIAQAVIVSLRRLIEDELALIENTPIGDDEVNAELMKSLEAFQDAIRWHVGLLIAIMKAATVEQV